MSVTSCPTCGGIGRLVSGACGTWVHCLAGHQTDVDTPLLRRARLRLILANPGHRPPWSCDERDRLADARDAHRLAYADALARLDFGASA